MNHMQNVNSTMRMMWIYKAGISLLCQRGGKPVSRLFCLCKTSPHLAIGSLGVCSVTVLQSVVQRTPVSTADLRGKMLPWSYSDVSTLAPYPWIPGSIMLLEVLSPVVCTIYLTFYKYYSLQLGFPCGSAGKESAFSETWVWFLGREYTLEKGKATHSSILPWRIPWTV